MALPPPPTPCRTAYWFFEGGNRKKYGHKSTWKTAEVDWLRNSPETDFIAVVYFHKEWEHWGLNRKNNTNSFKCE